MRELIYRDEAIKAVYDKDIGMLTQWDIGRNNGIDYAIKQLEKLPSAQPEPLTDKEQRIFLAAMRREEKVCRQVDGLVRTCHEIIRKVKGTLWT